MNRCPDLPILFQDAACVVVDKPGGLLAVPGRGPDKQDSVVSRLRHGLPWCIEQPAVHRLDMATSGLMVLGLTREAHRHLSRQFAERQVRKRYLALLDGEVAGGSGEICLAFRLDPDNRPHQVHDPLQGKPGISRWRMVEVRAGRTLVEFEPLTGRTHQLRLHASHPLGLGCPIVGDSLYGHGRQGDPLLLHATVLRFTHPVSNQTMTFASAASFAWPCLDKSIQGSVFEKISACGRTRCPVPSD
jgi:tRNA pseudouridine32 synthase/23S rRNA pseudouridine746 synthase